MQKKNKMKSKNYEDLITSLLSKDCQILQSGYRLTEMDHYYCPCDPEKNDPMCKYCFENCHISHHNNKENIVPIFDQFLCKCGLNYHKLDNVGEQNEFSFNNNCLFSEWSDCSENYIYYNLNGTNICMFCRNFCMSQQGKPFEKCIKSDKRTPSCECSDENHKNIKKIYEKLQEIYEKGKNDFSGLSMLQIINVIFKSENSFNNIFMNFKIQTEKIKKEIHSYLFDPYIGETSFGYALKCFTKINERIKMYNYFSKQIQSYFDQEYVKGILLKAFDSTSNGIWNVKKFLLINYRKSNFLKDFSPYPFFTVNDITNINPLLRLMIMANVQEDEYIKEKYNNNYLADIFNIINEFKLIKDRPKDLFIIFKNLYSIVKVMSKYNLIGKEDIVKYCQINEEFFAMCTEMRKEMFKVSKISLINEYLTIEQKILLPMLKSLIYLAFFQNDSVVIKSLRNEGSEDIGKTVFFHGESEISKAINKNLVNILNFIKINYHNDDSVEKPKINTNKTVKKLVHYSLELGSMNMNNPDIYLTGFRSLLDSNKIIYLNYLELKFTDYEKNFLNFIQKQSKGLETNYQKFFDCEIKLGMLIENTISFILEFFNFIEIPNFKIPQIQEDSINENFNPSFDYDSNVVVDRPLTKNKTLIFFKKHNDTFVNDNIEKIEDKETKDQVKLQKYRYLMNKSFLVFSFSKLIKIIGEQKQLIPGLNLNSENQLFDEILRLFYFYTENNIDNCLIVLGSEFIYNFYYADNENLEKLIDFYFSVLKQINRSHVHLSTIRTIFKVFRKTLQKISIDYSSVIFNKFLKFFTFALSIGSLKNDCGIEKIRKTLISIHQNCKIIKEFEEQLYLKGYVQFSTLIEKNEPKGIGQSIFESKGKSSDFDFENNNEMKPLTVRDSSPHIKKINSKLNQKNTDSRKNPVIYKVYLRYLRLLNICFESSVNADDIFQLQTIFKPNGIYEILKKKNLEILLRTEILKLFFISYINPLVDKRLIKDYLSVLSNQTEIEKFSSLFDNIAPFKLKEDLYKIQINFINLKQFHSILKHEIKNFREIVDKSSDTQRVMVYLEEGIIIPFYVYVDQFISFIFQHCGYDYLKLYELTHYFLKLKKYIFENKSRWLENQPREKGSIFRSSLNFSYQKGLLLYTADYSFDQLDKLDKDLETLKSQNFEILNYKAVYSILVRNQDFILKQKSISLKEYFDKRKLNYDENDVKELKSQLSKAGYFKHSYENKIFDMIIEYENDKQNLDASSFINNLSDIHETYSKRFRLLLISFIFYLVKSNLKPIQEIQNYWGLLRLLQFDTTEIQNDIILLYNNNEVDFNLLFNILSNNLIGLIFCNSNPAITMVNEQYYMSINIVKIMKYLCEEHNLYFQSIFFKLKIEYYQLKELEIKRDKINKSRIFIILLHILEKIFIISQWDLVDFSTQEQSICYFYDIFFVLVEFLIEMIQGTSSQNLETILEKRSNEIVTPFHRFLHTIKPILMNNNNNSMIVYNVRKDLTELIAAFIEEKNTQRKLIYMICNIITPELIFEMIVPTMKKVYLQLNNKNIMDYNTIEFDEKMRNFFTGIYVKNEDFKETIEFKLCNRLFQYVKLLDFQHGNEEAKQIISLKKNPENPTKFTQAVIFFESITRTVEVQQSDSLKIKVLFTLNPLTSYLSKNSKQKFIEEVSRDSRYSKVYSLMESSEAFLEEIKHYKNSSEKNFFMSFLLKINFYHTELILFFFTLIINVLMFTSITRVEELELIASASHSTNSHSASNSTHSSHPVISPVIIHPESMDITIRTTAFTQLGLCVVFAIIWLIVKFPLHYRIEKKKNFPDKKPNYFQKIWLSFYHVMILKQEFLIFIWNFSFILAAISSVQNYFIFSLQLLIIINLSETLKNIIKAITLRHKQLLTTALFVMIFINVFSSIAFFYMQDYFILDPDNVCSTLFYCFMTHLNLGLRTDGGIGERLIERNFITEKPEYMMTFFFGTVYFIIIIVILLAIVFGIVIDTFSELREYSQKVDYDKQNVCFICGATRDGLEKKGINFDSHTKEDHNIWNYLDYMISLKSVDVQDCNAINSFAIEMIGKKSISWFPAEEEDLESEE